MTWDPPVGLGDAEPDDAFDVGWDDADDLGGLRVPDTLGHVLEIDAVMASFVAQRAVSINRLRREALADPRRGSRATREIVERSVRLELAAALRITENAAGTLMARAEALVERYPRVLDALAGSRITERHADAVVDGLDEVEPHLRDDLLGQVLAMAEAQPLGTFRRALRRLLDSVRAQTLAERWAEALDDRRLVQEPAADGMAWLAWYGPAVEAQAIHDRVTAIAKVLAAREGETRTLDQLRADVFADLLIEGDTSAHPESARGIRARVVVTVPALSLLDDEAAAHDPATIEGVGPFPIERARELCGGADGWMRVLTHPETGVVLSVGRDLYRPPPALQRLVRWRAERCMAPGCGMPAARCEIDHTIAWEHGGETAVGNLAPLCTGHHTVKHHGGWSVRQHPGGVLEWTSPTGRVYLVEPERRMPAFAPDPSPPQPGEDSAFTPPF